MARSDLLVALVKAGTTGDRRAAKVAAESIIAEERAKQHNVLADRLTQIIEANGNAALPQPVSKPALETAIPKGREFIAEVTPLRRMDDLVLFEDCRHAVGQLIEEQQRASLLRTHGLEPRHKVLLVGPPGNGKTSLAEAIAEALALPFFVVRYEAIIGSFLGETAARLRRVFDYARTTPCVLFFDEFDALGKERGDIHETGEIKRVVTSLLMQIDDLPSYTIVVAATNHDELLDRAVWRRFQLRLILPAPSQSDLIEYFRRFFSSLNGSNVASPASIAKELGSISYAEAEQFTLDVRRRMVLGMNEEPVGRIVQDQLKLWRARKRAAKLRKRGNGDGGEATSGSAAAD
jgi:SpoVK/Ycf46/Vps4 family AAA+-type ATPase